MPVSGLRAKMPVSGLRAKMGVARKDGHRPFVVTGPLARVPGRGVARTIVDEVQLRIVRDPPPSAAAAGLPLVALPGLQARVLADRLTERSGFFGIDQQVVSRPLRMAPPYPLAALQVIGGHVAVDAELAAGAADQDFVLDHHRSGRASLTFCRIAVLCL